MARNDEEEIVALEEQASNLGYSAVAKPLLVISDNGHEIDLAPQFRWIASQLRMSAKTPAQRKRVRQEISKRTKELGDLVRAKHIQYQLPFSCIDLHDECVRKRKRQKKSPYLCFLALYICLARSMTALLAAITAAAEAGGHLR
jgi:hypothetical protein